MISTLFNLLGSLGVFLFGMRVMSDGLQKAAGSRMQSVLGYMTKNRFFAVLTGFFITALIQSSSATTVMVVSFVNASLLSLTQAIGVIMGANIGTTVTTWIVSFVGFKFKITAIALPIVGIGLPFVLSSIKSRKNIGEILVGFGLLFLGLSFLKESVPDIKHNPEVMAFLQNYTDLGFLSFLIFVFVGTILTVVVQSSSAAMAITVTMAYKGWIDFDTSAAIVLGENIGTTITAFLASIGTTVNARRSARAHMLFNVFGVVWMAIVFRYFTKMILNIAPWDSTLQSNLPLNLSLFHSVFNVMNTLIFIAFIPQFAKLVEKMVKSGKLDKLKKYTLQYISTGLQDTPQLNIIKVKNELTEMAKIIDTMFTKFQNILHNPDKKMGNEVEEIEDMERLTDEMQSEITKFLVECSKENLTEKDAGNVNAMMRIVNELEHIADSCVKLTYLMRRRYDKKIQLPVKAIKELDEFSVLIQEFIDMYKNKVTEHFEKQSLELAYKLEKKINQARDEFRKEAQERMINGADVNSELLYIDILRHFEHIGDNSLNIAQALRKIY